MKEYILSAALMLTATAVSAQMPSSYVDPRIGSEGLGRTYIGPTTPYGMIKPSPDGVSMPNSGWAPMPEPIKGFSQVHVSGTGGGQKYGNILVMPFTGTDRITFAEAREDETISLGYYSTTLASGITTEITTADKAAIYRLAYPCGTSAALAIDAGAFLGMSPIPDQRETQQFVGSQIEVVSSTEIRGYNRVRGGWNNGRAYTVYFYAVTDRPFTASTWKGETLTDSQWQSDTHQPTGAILRFAQGTDTMRLKIAVSFLSELKARDNLLAEVHGWDFDAVHSQNLTKWDDLLSRIEISPSATEQQRRMFYTGLYHTMIMPTDRSGENPLWADDTPYYDDYYAIWDTYRTSSPMITLIDPAREIDLVNSLLSIYRRDGYLPDARSGNANGRTQGGSNAEIVIADAFVKGLDGIDYDLALEAMLKDADVPPGGNEEAEGRGGLREYNTLGYIPWGIPRAGNRTVEYSYCDYAIAQVAKGLGRDDLYDRFMRQSGNWRNLWRGDYEHAGSRGFIMPRDADGVWLDSLPQGHSQLYRPMYVYTPVTFEGPWYKPWWDMFFYEASSWEYSLSIPHDVEGLIEMCGGSEAFERRLDTFFDQGFYNVNNEPSFLTPCLYHWLGKPWRSSERIARIIADNYNDGPVGLPGNDDSGAMSSWLAFHMIGLYPNAGQDYYLINSPMLESTTFHLANGNDFTVRAKNFSPKNPYIVKAELNGVEYPYSSLRHSDLMRGGTLTLTMGKRPSDWGREPAPERPCERPVHTVANNPLTVTEIPVDPANLRLTCKLHGQTRRYNVAFSTGSDGTVTMSWGIERNLKWQQGTFTVGARAVADGDILDFTMPVDGEHVTLGDNATAYIISRRALSDLKTTGSMTYNKVRYTVTASAIGTITARGTDGSEILVLDNDSLPLILQMRDNPLEVNWTLTQIKI